MDNVETAEKLGGANPWQDRARFAKVFRLTMSIDAALDEWGIDPFSPAALEIVLSMTKAARAQALRSAGLTSASETTWGIVTDTYAKRVEVRVALSRLTAPLPRAAR